MNSIKRQKDMTLKDELHRPVGAQYATGEASESFRLFAAGGPSMGVGNITRLLTSGNWENEFVLFQTAVSVVICYMCCALLSPSVVSDSL